MSRKTGGHWCCNAVQRGVKIGVSRQGGRRGGTPGGPPTGVRKRQRSVLLHQPQHTSNLTCMRIADPRTGKRSGPGRHFPAARPYRLPSPPRLRGLVPCKDKMARARAVGGEGEFLRPTSRNGTLNFPYFCRASSRSCFCPPVGVPPGVPLDAEIIEAKRCRVHVASHCKVFGPRRSALEQSSNAPHSFELRLCRIGRATYPAMWILVQNPEGQAEQGFILVVGNGRATMQRAVV